MYVSSIIADLCCAFNSGGAGFIFIDIANIGIGLTRL